MGGLEGGRLDPRPSGDANSLVSLQLNWKVKHDEAEKHTQNNLKGTDETSAIPEEATKRKLSLTAAWKQSAVIFQM